MTMATSRKAARSGKMECPICKKKRPLVEHHINGKNIPEKNRRWNRAYICAGCHDEVHSDRPDRIVIVGWFATTNGRELIWHKKNEPSQMPDFPDCNPPLYTNKLFGS